MEGYKTIRGFGKVKKLYVDSLFISYAIPVNSEKEAKEFIRNIKEAHSDATHTVSAYRVREGNTLLSYYDDDGEPREVLESRFLKFLNIKVWKMLWLLLQDTLVEQSLGMED